MKLRIIALALPLVLAGTAAQAYNYFDYLYDVAWGEYSYYCSGGCRDFGDGSFDVGITYSLVISANAQASGSWEFLQRGENGWTGCGSAKSGAYDLIGEAWYYGALPDADPGANPPGWGDVWYLVNITQYYMDYYLADCSED